MKFIEFSIVFVFVFIFIFICGDGEREHGKRRSGEEATVGGTRFPSWSRGHGISFSPPTTAPERGFLFYTYIHTHIYA